MACFDVRRFPERRARTRELPVATACVFAAHIALLVTVAVIVPLVNVDWHQS